MCDTLSSTRCKYRNVSALGISSMRLLASRIYPTRTQVPELKSACKEMGEMVSGTKPELVVRLLAHFGLPDGRRCPVPLRLWLALRQERNSYARPSPRNNTQVRPRCHFEAKLLTAVAC